MNTITLDMKKMTSREAAHEYIARELGFPSYYGGNLDALYDCLGDICQPTSIELIHRGEDRLGDYADRLIRVLCAAADGNDYLQIVM